ncbi:MAG TPA: pyridoxamine 5'-phosphate oxidase family protein [Actinomycetota bacterium]|nr:pyridoxamine 5'-phosphate oxidase family protein [Actinomycetota bacterium]
MASWGEVEVACPGLAAKVRGRFEAHGLALIATLRKDGGPRISGIEVTFAGDELWLGMMPGSLKAKDLLRDPRCALHSATVDKDVKEGDAKITARAVAVEDDATFQEFARATGAGDELEPGGFHLFRLDVTETSFLVPAGDHLDIEAWSDARGYRKTERR